MPATYRMIGDVITYSFTVSNEGNVPLTNVTVTDPLVGISISGGPIDLAVGASDNSTFTASYTITQDDINAGGVTNQATATGTDTNGDPVTDLSDDNSVLEDDATVTELTQSPAIAIVKTASVGGDGEVGDVITYSFTVSNEGNVPLTNVTVTDPLVGISISGGPIDLAVGASDNSTFTASYTITQDDINAGGVTNQATATGTDTNGDPVTDLSDDNSVLEDDATVTELTQSPAIAIVKTASVGGDGEVGDVITYSFTVSNEGNVPLTNVTVTDPLVGISISGGPIDLAVGASDNSTFTASYTITQDDINAGGVTNQATATGTDTNGDPVTDLSDDNSVLEDDATVTELTQSPAIAIVKTASVGGDGEVGDVITYSFTVSNEGNVPLTNVTVTDPLVGISISGGPIDLAVGASDNSTFTASYTITQDDINAGGVTNQATATGTDTNGDPVTDLSDDNSVLEDDATVTELTQSPAIAIVKTASVGGDGEVGDVITYSFTVSNEGNVPLTNVTVTDPLVGISISGGPIDLAVGASDNSTFTASYTITQDDINAGGVTNQATATGTDTNGDPVTDLSDDNSVLEDDATVTELTQSPAIAIVKTASVGGDGEVGDVITYSFTVSNEGNVPLTNVTVTDPLVGISISGGPIDLAVGASDNSTFTASYTITQDDINAGGVTNQATATGTDTNGDPVTDLSDDNSVLEDDATVTELTQSPAIAIVKTASVGGDGEVGDVITYSFTVSNEGNVPLTNVTVTDPLVGISISGGPIDLAVGASDNSTFTASYTITQDDINAGGVTNQATATGTDTNGDPVTDLSDDNSVLEDDATVTELTQSPAIAIVKTASVGGDGEVGDVITYSFTVSNEGNVPLTNVTVTDPLVGISISGGPIDLAVGASDNSTFTASYTITQDDINAGGVTNQATATGTDTNGDPVTDLSDDNSVLEDDATVTELTQSPAIAIVKTASVGGDGEVGDVITYSFTVSNEGNVPLTNVTVTDPLVGISISGGPIDLAVGASDNSTFTASYTITQDDINAGGVTNQATATGTDTNGDPVTDLSDDNSVLEDDATVTELTQSPAIAIVKTASVGGDGEVGDVITYSFTVSNEGNVPLTNVTVTDPLVGISISGGPIDLAVGASDNSTFTASYTITQDDINAGGVTNQATATGTDTNGDPVTDLSDDNSVLEDDATVTELTQSPAIAIVKTASVGGDGEVGDVITYSFTVSNEGNVPLTNVTVTDPLVGISISGGPIDLAVGASDNSTFTASYTITQDDINAGGVTNQATATGTDTNGDPVTDLSDDNSVLEDDATVTELTQSPAIAIVKTASVGGYSKVGDVLHYTITVSNSGNVTIANVVVTDNNADAGSLSYVSGDDGDGLLQVGEEWTYSAIHTVTQSDLDAGSFVNVASVTGDDPADNPVSDDTPPVTVIYDGVANSTYAQNDFNNTYINTSVSGNVLTNDEDFEGDNIAVTTPHVISDLGVEVSIDPLTGGYLYIPPTGYVGSDKFEYTICDDGDNQACDAAVVFISILPSGIECNNCEGRITSLTLRYEGEAETMVKVVQKKGDNVFEQSVAPGEEFEFYGTEDATLGTEISIYADDVLNTTIHTSCSLPIGTGMKFGDFVIVEGYSKEGGPLGSGECDVYPIANLDNAFTAKDESVTGNLTENDFDPDGDVVSINTNPVELPDNGTVTINSDGTYIYTPDSGFIGEDSFVYGICDQDNLCSNAIVNITVLPISTNITQANDDAYNGEVNSLINGNVLANDFDNEEDSQHVTSLVVVTDQGVTVNIDPVTGEFSYIAPTGYVGPDKFIYSVCDNGIPQACDDATVYLTIEGAVYVNTTYAVNDTFETFGGVEVSGNVMDNDYDLEGDNQKVSMVTVISSEGVEVRINPGNGNFTYMPPEGFAGVDTFRYTVCDDNVSVACDEATVLIMVYLDSDNDGVADYIDIDDDNDGILDVHEVDLATGEDIDSDGDGIVDRLDIDSDGDGIVDNIEWQTEDYVPLKGKDSDGDGWDDAYDTDSNGTYYLQTDTDMDGIPDYLDLDSDNDNIPDVNEGNDANFDGIADYLPVGQDTDEDGLDDIYDTVAGRDYPDNPSGSNVPLTDYDNDGIRDWRDPDDNNDGNNTTGPDDKYASTCELLIPEIFTPNDDGIQDNFKIKCIEHYPDARLEVYNRWGNLVYSKDHYGNTDLWGENDAWWNGYSTHKWTVGKDRLPSATYIYILYLNDGSKPRNGFVFLNR